MTREEIKNIVRHVFHFYDANADNYSWTDMNEACSEIIKALEQEPCEDAVSRTEITDELNRLGRNAFKDDTDYDNFFAFLDSLPSVTPTRKKGKWIPCRANEECPLRERLDRAGISYEEGNFEEGKIDFKLNPPTAEEYTKWMEEYFNRK